MLITELELQGVSDLGAGHFIDKKTVNFEMASTLLTRNVAI